MYLPKKLQNVLLGLCLLAGTACDRCEDAPKFTEEEKRLLPQEKAGEQVTFKSSRGQTTTFYIRDKKLSEPKGGGPRISFKGSSCAADNGSQLYAIYSEGTPNPVAGDAFSVAIKKTWSSTEYYYNGSLLLNNLVQQHAISAENELKVGDRTFQKVLKFSNDTTYLGNFNGLVVHTVYYAPGAGLVRYDSRNNVVWERQF